MAALFFSYSHKDERLRDQLETHLAMLKRQNVISTWHDRRLVAGDDIDKGISGELEHADIILLLVSPDFLASEYCYGVEMTRALKRHHAGEARVIPVILRPCEWTQAPFGKLLAAPKDGKPVTKWPDPDDAFLDVAKAIRAAAKAGARPAPTSSLHVSAQPVGPRSSNLRVRKIFTERDRDLFLEEAFEFMSRFFENSLRELESRNQGLETRFKRIDTSRFSAAIYRDGEVSARCLIRLGGFVGGISLSHGENPRDNSFNENLSVEAGEQELHLKAMGMPMHRGVSNSAKLGLEGAAEYYWGLFVEPLQR